MKSVEGVEKQRKKEDGKECWLHKEVREKVGKKDLRETNARTEARGRINMIED